MRVKIQTSKDKYYRQLLELLRPFPPFNALNNKDANVLGRIMKEYMGLKGLTHENRCQIVFSTDVRRKIAKDCSMSEAAFNNSVSKLKKLKVIENKIYLNKDIVQRLKPVRKLEILFQWKQEKQ